MPEELRPPGGPLPLLLLTDALAEDLGDGRLDKTGAEALPRPGALAVVGDAGPMAVHVRVACFHGLQAFPSRALVRGGHRPLQVDGEGSDLLDGVRDMARPERPGEVRPRSDDRVTQGVPLLRVLEGQGPPCRGLLPDGQAHGEGKPIEAGLGVRGEVAWALAPRVAALGETRALGVQLLAWRVAPLH